MGIYPSAVIFERISGAPLGLSFVVQGAVKMFLGAGGRDVANKVLTVSNDGHV